MATKAPVKKTATKRAPAKKKPVAKATRTKAPAKKVATGSPTRAMVTAAKGVLLAAKMGSGTRKAPARASK